MNNAIGNAIKDAIVDFAPTPETTQESGINIQLHKFPFGVVNRTSPLGRMFRDVETGERFVQQLFNNGRISELNIDDIQLSGEADKIDRWAMSFLAQFEYKAYAFVEPFMVPKKVGFDMVPFYFWYDPTLKSLEMKMGLGVDIAQTFKENGIDFSEEELKSPTMFNDIVTTYFENTPMIIVVFGQKMPLYEYPDRAWRFSSIKNDPETMEKLKDYFAKCEYQPRDDRYYFIVSRPHTDEDGNVVRSYWLEKENRRKDLE